MGINRFFWLSACSIGWCFIDLILNSISVYVLSSCHWKCRARLSEVQLLFNRWFSSICISYEILWRSLARKLFKRAVNLFCFRFVCVIHKFRTHIFTEDETIWYKRVIKCNAEIHKFMVSSLNQEHAYNWKWNITSTPKLWNKTNEKIENRFLLWKLVKLLKHYHTYKAFIACCFNK